MLLTHIHRLYRVGTHGALQKSGAEMADAEVLKDAWVHIEGEKIAALGTMDELPPNLPVNPEEEVDCSGRLVMPGFVDSHTHLVFPFTREQEFVMRLKGMTYEEIARQGGGILNSAKRLPDISDEELYESTLNRAYEILNYGTTTVEIKSGYGLTLEGELRLLRVAKAIKEAIPLNVRTTFLGAHAIPVEYQSRRQAYIDLVCEEMLPRVVEEKLADHIDVFCDTGFFTVEETEYILQKGLDYGLPGKIHANELDFSGGVQAGVRKRAWSVDHLERAGKAEIEALQGSETIPTLLPSVAFFLGIDYPLARDMIAANLPVALATDYNPGSSPGGSMPFVMSLACMRMKMLPEEALVAATLNGARALRMSDKIGSLEPGKQADLLVTAPADDLGILPYAYASNMIEMVMIRGQWE